MAKFRAGKTSRATVNSATLSLPEWRTTYRGSDQDTTNFEDNGFETGILGPIGLDWSFTGNWDAGQNYLDDPPGLYPRDDGTNMHLFTKVADNKKYALPLFRCLNSDVAASATGKVTFNSSGKNQGAFTVPSGSV